MPNAARISAALAAIIVAFLIAVIHDVPRSNSDTPWAIASPISVASDGRICQRYDMFEVCGLPPAQGERCHYGAVMFQPVLTCHAVASPEILPADGRICGYIEGPSAIRNGPRYVFNVCHDPDPPNASCRWAFEHGDAQRPIRQCRDNG